MEHHHHTNTHNYSPPPPPQDPASLSQSQQNLPVDGLRKRDRSRPQKRNPLLIPLIVVSVIALTVSGLYISTFVDTSEPQTTLADAVQECEVEEDSYISVEDEGTSLIMTSRGTESPGASIFDIDCVLDALEVPSSIMNRIETTRALDGTQSGTWDEFEATWNYHPNSGSNITITVVDN